MSGIVTLSVSGLMGVGPLIDSTTGATLNAVTVRTTDEKVSIEIPASTTMRTSAGVAITSLSVAAATAPAQPPNGAILLNYNFGPDGAIFTPPLTITFTYDESQLPAGAVEADLYAAFWDGSAWVKLESTVNAQTNTVVARVPHFTNVAVVAPQPAPPPPPAPAPEPTPAPEPVPPPPPPAAAAPTLAITSPSAGATVDAGNIVVTVQVSDFQLEPPGPVAAGKGHLHYYMDVEIPTEPGKPAVSAPGTYKASPGTSATWENVPAGTHTFGAQLVNGDHTPLGPPITATITVTVRAAEVTAPPPPPATPAPETPPAGINWWWVIVPVAAVIVIFLVILFTRRAGRAMR